jgi:CHAT domain-containing protein
LNRVLDKGDFWYERYQFDTKKEFLQNALDDYKLADKILDIIRFDSSDNISKLFWRDKEANLYIKAIEVSHLLNDKQSAYVFMERNKALLLLEELNDFKAKSISKLPIDLIERDFKYKQKIIKIEESNILNKTTVLFDIKIQYEKFKDSLSIHYPSYSKLRKTLPILNFNSHKSKFITKDNASIQFIISKNKAYGFMISDNTTDLYEINELQYLKEEIIELAKMLQYPFATQVDIDKYVRISNSIFNKLIPVSVYDKLKDKKLSISPDGILHNIPFEALITDALNENSYLIKNNDISYVYSFSHLLLNNKRKRNPKNTFLGFAPNKFDDESLANLPNSIQEVENINSIFKDKIFINGQASKYNFISNLDDYKLIHLATHSGQNNFEKPWLAFNDSKVNLNEIYATQNQADLVVLSACKTSKGKLFSGEGVMSLARGFFISGTKSVISSLWNINDKTTQIIMSSFYKNLKDGKSKSKALQDSKLAYLQSNEGTMSSPYYWSSFILIGDSQIVYFDNSNNSILFLSILLVVFFLGFIFKKAIQRQFHKT